MAYRLLKYLQLPLLLHVFLLLNSCAPKLQEVKAPIEEPEPFSITGTQAVPEKWWTAFVNILYISPLQVQTSE